MRQVRLSESAHLARQLHAWPPTCSMSEVERPDPRQRLSPRSPALSGPHGIAENGPRPSFVGVARLEQIDDGDLRRACQGANAIVRPVHRPGVSIRDLDAGPGLSF